MDFTQLLKGNDSKAVQKYKDDGNDLNRRDIFGNSLVLQAIQSKKMPIIRFLFDTDMNLAVTDMRGRGCLHYAAEADLPVLVPLYFMKRLGQRADLWKHANDFHNQCYGKFEDFCVLLQKYRVPNPLIQEDEANAVIDEEVSTEEPPDRANMIYAFHDAAVEPGQSARGGETPMHLAAASGSVMSVRILASIGGPVDKTDNNLMTPMHYAAMNDRPDVVAFLLELGANALVPDIDGNVPAHLAAKVNSSETIKVLANKGVDLNTKNELGRTPLHVAAELGNIEAIEALLEKNADPNQRDIYGWAPLMLSIKGGFDKLSQILVQAGTIPY